MKWNAQKYQETCGRVTEQGKKLVDILREIGGNKVLDLGCGTGVLTNEIAKFAHEVIGIDSSSEMIEKAASMHPELKFMVMDACSLPWENYFDAVFSNAVFHFIKAQDILLYNIHRALAQNGVLVCEFGASGNIAELLDAVAGACIKRGKPYSMRFYYPKPEEYVLLLERQGFCVKSVITYNPDTKLKGESGLGNWINQIFCVEMECFDISEREEVFKEIENALRPAQWDGSSWSLPNNRRMRVVAHK